jgi:membrane protein YdbS with pleckstrin-like domain
MILDRMNRNQLLIIQWVVLTALFAVTLTFFFTEYSQNENSHLANTVWWLLAVVILAVVTFIHHKIFNLDIASGQLQYFGKTNKPSYFFLASVVFGGITIVGLGYLYINESRYIFNTIYGVGIIILGLSRYHRYRYTVKPQEVLVNGLSAIYLNARTTLQTTENAIHLTTGIDELTIHLDSLDEIEKTKILAALQNSLHQLKNQHQD